MKEPGYVYILTNPSFREDWIKIGMSSRPVPERLRELDNTSVPLPFEIYATLRTVKFEAAEKHIHRMVDRLTDLRIRKNREFFNIHPAKALELFRDEAELLDDAYIEIYRDGKVVDSTSYMFNSVARNGDDSTEESSDLRNVKLTSSIVNDNSKSGYDNEVQSLSVREEKPLWSDSDNESGLDEVYYLEGRNYNAIGFFDYRSNKMLVKAGSVVSLEETSSCPNKEKRQKILSKKAERTSNGFLIKEDLSFISPSGSSSFVIGSSTNGWREWKDKNGLQLLEKRNAHSENSINETLNIEGNNKLSSDEENSIQYIETEEAKIEQDNEAVVEFEYFLESSKYRAKGIFDIRTKQFVVKAGSIAALVTQSSCHNSELRMNMLDEHTERVSNGYVLKHDVIFNSPSGASVFITGSSTNGYKVWKNRKGQSLSEILKEL
ncbi:MAG: DUF4357 domain-containing protein [Bacteroidales bacterium]|nr:DUF4357 domain-containing protein [Bacteroidales bacterium]